VQYQYYESAETENQHGYVVGGLFGKNDEKSGEFLLNFFFANTVSLDRGTTGGEL